MKFAIRTTLVDLEHETQAAILNAIPQAMHPLNAAGWAAQRDRDRAELIGTSDPLDWLLSEACRIAGVADTAGMYLVIGDEQ
jgi:hypothetical protein